MDFFEQQDQAHRQSRKLLFLFFLAVLAIVLTVNVSLALVWKWAYMGHGPVVYPRGFFFVNTFVTLLFIGGGTLFETYRLREGGDGVAQLAGGRLVMPSSTDTKERRLLNIVEEMALAAGIACPRVYVLEREEAINAFAAGYHQNEAVVAVTYGALSRLDRDELQGVIGHEFSHILNGDMRMNIKLIGVLFGIQMLAGFGQELMYWGSRMGGSRSRDDKGPSLQLVMLAAGVTLFVVGYVGIFFGRLIKSAVSRQREFLADASSVQFTRNPDGIGGALRKIGGLTQKNNCGSRIDNPRAEQMSHMFLGAAKASLMSGLFATHPPLKERLQRVYGREVEFLDASEIVDPEELAGMPEGVYGFGARNVEAAQQARSRQAHNPAAANTTMAAAAIPSMPVAALSSAAHTGYPARLLQAARDPSAAAYLVYAMLLDSSQNEAYALQLNFIRQADANAEAQVTALAKELEQMESAARLPLLDLAMPALRLKNSAERSQLLALAAKLIAADQHMSQGEFVLQTVLERRLGPQAGRVVTVRYADLRPLRGEVCLLLSLVAQSHGAERAQTVFARAYPVLAQLSLQESDLRAITNLDFFEVRQALEKLNQLAPLAKPFLIKALLAVAARAPEVRIEAGIADLLRGICAAIDAPLPDVLNAVR